MSDRPETFAEYLMKLGVDMNDVTSKFVRHMAGTPSSIMAFYERYYPDEFTAWKVKQRILK